MLSCQLVLHAPSFMPFSVSLPFNAYFHGRHVDWIVPSLVTICHLETHLSKKPTSSYYQTVFSCKETQSRPRMGRVSHWTVSYGRRPLRLGLFDSSRNFDLHLKQSRPPCLSRSTSLRPWHGKLQKIDLTKKRPFTDLQQVETPSLEHPRAIEHSHSNRHHGYQIEDIEIHIWQQNTPTSRTTSYRIYNEQPRLEYPSPWQTRTQSSTWTCHHNYSAALPSLPDRHRSHHRCTSTQQSHCAKTSPLLWPPPLQQERGELLPADPAFFIWVEQNPPVRLRSGWAYQLHQHLISLSGHLSWHGPLHQQWGDALGFSLQLFHRCRLSLLALFFSVGLGINLSFRSPIGAKGSTTPLPDTVPFYSMSS